MIAKKNIHNNHIFIIKLKNIILFRYDKNVTLFNIKLIKGE